MSKAYTSEQAAFLAHGFKLWRYRELTWFFNAWFGTEKTAGQIKAAVKNRRLTCGRAPGFDKGTLRAWTREQAEYLTTNYRAMPVAELTAAFNSKFGAGKTEGAVKAFLHNRRISSGRDGRFAKGHASWNAGTKGQGLTGANRGSFKTGNRPKTYLPVGSEIRDTDGYWKVKVADPNKWKFRHILNWEKEHGPVPAGMILIFTDNNHDNCSPANLELITRPEHIRLNALRYATAPSEFKPVLKTIAKIKMKIGEARKERAGGGCNPSPARS
jgi:hypothetical protein